MPTILDVYRVLDPHYDLFDLNIVHELMCCINRKYSDKTLLRMFDIIKECYLKTNSFTLNEITHCVVKHYKDIPLAWTKWDVYKYL